jgi:hypothetical protein
MQAPYSNYTYLYYRKQRLRNKDSNRDYFKNKDKGVIGLRLN